MTQEMTYVIIGLLGCIAFLLLALLIQNGILASGAKKDRTPAAGTAPAKGEMPAPVTENLTDDLELVAVITAALAASLSTTPDRLIVRSIRRAEKNPWKRA